MKTNKQLAVIMLVITGLIFLGCAKDENPTNPADQSNQDSFPTLNFENDGEGDKTPVAPEDLVGTWTLVDIYPIYKEQAELNVSYVFEEDGSGQIVKEEESFEFGWTLDEWVLEFNHGDDKTWDMNAIILDDYLYLYDEHKNKDKDKDKDWYKEKDKKEYSKYTKMKLAKEQ
jgi:hypothetical protein